MTWTTNRCGTLTEAGPCVLPPEHDGDHAPAGDGSVPADPATVAAARQTTVQLGYVAAVAGVGAVIGSLLPWATAQTGLGSFSVAGTDGDGLITLVVGLAVALLAFPVDRFRGRRLMALLAALGLAAMAVMEVVNVTDRVASSSTDNLRASVGIGLWLTAAAGVVAVAALVMSVRQPTGD